MGRKGSVKGDGSPSDSSAVSKIDFASHESGVLEPGDTVDKFTSFRI